MFETPRLFVIGINFVLLCLLGFASTLSGHFTSEPPPVDGTFGVVVRYMPLPPEPSITLVRPKVDGTLGVMVRYMPLPPEPSITPAQPKQEVKSRQKTSFIPPKPRFLADAKRSEARYKRTLAQLKRRSRCLPGSMRRVLARVAQEFGRIRVISTFRRGATIAGTNTPSYHRYCRAVDFHVANRAAAVRWLRRHWRGGLGTYSGGMHHVHIDNGPRVRFHHRVGRTGRRLRKRRRHAKRRGNWSRRNFGGRT